MNYKFCTYFNYVFLNYCFSGQWNSASENSVVNSRFEVQYQWTYLNYTWTSRDHYSSALYTGQYVPANNAPVGMKIYKNHLFLSVPRFRRGIPVTLTYLEKDSLTDFENPLLTPFPDWAFNDDAVCTNLQSVQSMEIDTKGVMWVIDGVRINNYTRCPTKLMLFDLNEKGKLIHTHVFPNEISLRDGGFLNDLVIDETDGGFAYITDNSAIDPGIIVYSKWKDRAWKLRDVSMYPEPKAGNFPVGNVVFSNAAPVDGIALSPAPNAGEKTLFYCALTAFSLYSISTGAIKNEQQAKLGTWRRKVKLVGEKIAQGDGLIVDDRWNLYSTLLPLYGVSKWNVFSPIWTSKVIDQNKTTMIWPDGFAFDQQGYLYLISNQVFNFIDPNRTPKIDGNVKFRVMKMFTGTNSYLYGPNRLHEEQLA